MLDERAARRGAQAAVGAEKVEDIAIAFPVGTTRTQATGVLKGDAAGAAAGLVTGVSSLAGANLASGAGSLGMLLAQRRLEKTEPAASIVLALTASNLYLLGRHHIGPLASFKDLEVIHKIPRGEVETSLTPEGITRELTIVDEGDGARFVYEVKPLGSGIKQLIADLK